MTARDIETRLDGMTEQEIRDLKASVKAPNKCKSGDPDLKVWWACQDRLSNLREKRQGEQFLSGVADHYSFGGQVAANSGNSFELWIADHPYHIISQDFERGYRQTSNELAVI